MPFAIPPEMMWLLGAWTFLGACGATLLLWLAAWRLRETGLRRALGFALVAEALLAVVAGVSGVWPVKMEKVRAVKAEQFRAEIVRLEAEVEALQARQAAVEEENEKLVRMVDDAQLRLRSTVQTTADLARQAQQLQAANPKEQGALTEMLQGLKDDLLRQRAEIEEEEKKTAPPENTPRPAEKPSKPLPKK